jgi:hypothetical protein
MYALTAAKHISEQRLPSLLLSMLTRLQLDRLEVLCKEVDPTEWNHDLLLMPRDAAILHQALVFLMSDRGFFTLSCKGRALVIPFEGAHFNVVLGDKEIVPDVEGLRVQDVTEVLGCYRDAYEGFGLDKTFAR